MGLEPALKEVVESSSLQVCKQWVDVYLRFSGGLEALGDGWA